MEYLHLNEIKTSLNSEVDMGTQIGTVGGWGTSGPTDYGYHLDFRIYQFINKSNKNYSDDTVKIFYDPFEFFDFDIQYNYRISDDSTHDYH